MKSVKCAYAIWPQSYGCITRTRSVKLLVQCIRIYVTFIVCSFAFESLRLSFSLKIICVVESCCYEVRNWFKRLLYFRLDGQDDLKIELNFYYYIFFESN